MSQEFDSKQQDNIAADVDEVMRKYDRESNTRIWTGWQKIVVKVLMVAFALYCIAMTLFSKAMAEIRLPLFMGFIVITGIFIAVHLEAKKLGLRGLSRDELPKWKMLARDCYLLIPLILLV